MPRDLLSYLFLVDVVEGWQRFKLRLVGTESTIAAGQKLTDRHIDEVNLSQAPLTTSPTSIVVSLNDGVRSCR